ncbi:MAG: UbiA family prenyltransferase [Promethearchaeota archaeon]
MVRNKIAAVIGQCRFFVLPLGFLAIMSGHILAENYSLVLLFWTSLSFVFVHIFMASVNNTYDVKFDRVSIIMSNTNPIVSGELTLQEAKIINLTTLLLALITSVFAGFYWIVLIIIGIGLVMIYDLQPVRMKDRPLGILIPPLYLALPFLFSYVNATSSFTFPPSFFLIFLFLFINGVTAVRHIPDLERDVEMDVQNFTTRYKVVATRNLELIVSIVLPAILVVAIMLGLLSIVGFPILLLATIFRVNLLTKPQEALKDPRVWERFAQLMVINSTSILLSITAKVFSWI